MALAFEYNVGHSGYNTSLTPLTIQGSFNDTSMPYHQVAETASIFLLFYNFAIVDMHKFAVTEVATGNGKKYNSCVYFLGFSTRHSPILWAGSFKPFFQSSGAHAIKQPCLYF